MYLKWSNQNRLAALRTQYGDPSAPEPTRNVATAGLALSGIHAAGRAVGGHVAREVAKRQAAIRGAQSAASTAARRAATSAAARTTGVAPSTAEKTIQALGKVLGH